MAQNCSTPKRLASNDPANGHRQGRPPTVRQRTPSTGSGGVPEWLIVVLALAFVFVGLPILMPILWALYLIAH